MLTNLKVDAVVAVLELSNLVDGVQVVLGVQLVQRSGRFVEGTQG